MKYILLIYADEQGWTEAERELCYGEFIELTHQLKSKGLSASPLQPVATATSIQVRGSKRIIKDGPFSEAREQLGGFFLVDVRTSTKPLPSPREYPAHARARSKYGL